MRRTVSTSLVNVVAFSLLLFSHACLGVDEAAQRIQQAIDELAQQSSQWQVTLQNLEKDLFADGESFVATEVTQLAQRGIGTGGAEIRCDADFIKHRMQEGLQQILDKRQNKTPQPLRQYFCGVAPTSVNLSLTPDRRTELDFYGYNLDAGRAAVYVKEASGSQRTIVNAQLIVATPTHYLMTVNLSSNGLALTATDQQIVFVLNQGLSTEESHAVNVIAPTVESRFSVVAGSSTVVAGGGGFSQGPYRRTCAEGSVGIGLTGKSNDFITQIQLVCAVLNGNGSLGGHSSPQADGGNDGDAFDLMCPAGQALVGFTGRSSGNVERVGLQCNSAANVVAARGIVTTIGPNRDGGGGSPFSSSCKTQSAVTGLVIWSNDRVSRMDFACSELQLK
jgi:hypothetical protein